MLLLEILKGGVSFKTKTSNWWTKSFIRICVADFFQSTRACLTKPKENCMIKQKLPWTLNYIQKRNFMPQIIFVILTFLYITWKRLSQNMRFFCKIIKTTMVDHVNQKIAHPQSFPYWGVPPPAKNFLSPPHQ